MTESEWLASEDPEAMLADLEAQPLPPGNRKLTLFAAACALARGSDPDSVERVAKEMPARQWARAWASRVENTPSAWVPQAYKAALLRDVVGNPFRPVAYSEVKGDKRYYHWPSGKAVSWGEWNNLLTNGTIIRREWLSPQTLALAELAYARHWCERCIGPNGERLHYTGRAQHEPCPRCGRAWSWADGGALDPLTLAALADALEEAGCDGTTYDFGGYGTAVHQHPIPAHLRRPGPHVRGCWALDLILGKE